MCYKCDGFSETIKIKHPYEFFNIVDQVRVVLNEGTMKIVESNCDLNDIRKGRPFPEDITYHVFQCTNCGRKFSLCVETYHGSGGVWEVVPSYKEISSTPDTNTLDEDWERFLSVCQSKYDGFTDTLRHLLDDIEMPEDIKIVTIVQLEEHAREWIGNCIPVMNYQKPIDCIKTQEGLILLKATLMSMPS